MSRISLEHLSAAIRKVQAMSLPQKADLTDEIFAHQPNLLAAVLVQHRLGVSYAKMDILIDILLVCYRAMKETGLTWPLISEEDQEYQMTRSTAIIQSFEKLDADSQTQFTGQFIDEFPERGTACLCHQRGKGMAGASRPRAKSERKRQVRDDGGSQPSELHRVCVDTAVVA
jgi:hypothetical protein